MSRPDSGLLEHSRSVRRSGGKPAWRRLALATRSGSVSMPCGVSLRSQLKKTFTDGPPQFIHCVWLSRRSLSTPQRPTDISDRWVVHGLHALRGEPPPHIISSPSLSRRFHAMWGAVNGLWTPRGILPRRTHNLEFETYTCDDLITCYCWSMF